MPLKLGKDPIESFLKPRKVSRIQIEPPSYGWLRQEDSESPDLRLEGQASSRGSTNSLAPNDSVRPEPDPVTRHCSKVGVFSV